MQITRRRGTPRAKRRGAPPGTEPELLDLPLPGAVADGELPRRRPNDAGPAPSAAGSAPRSGRRRPRRSGWVWLLPLLAFPIGAIVGFLLRSDPPVAALSVDLLDFGEVRLGEIGAELTVRLANRGELPLEVDGISLAGEAAGDFRLVADDCSGAEVPARTSCTMRLTFAPADRGVRRSRMTLRSNGIGGPQSVPLFGVGVTPELAVEPGELDFGVCAVGSGGESAALELENRGTAPLVLGQIRLEGAAADFRRVADDCSRRRLEPRQRCGVRYAFAPAAAGERRATVRIEHDAGGEPARVPLVGHAVVRRPRLVLDPERVDFGRLLVTEAARSRVVTLKNAGDGELEIRELRLSAADGAFEMSGQSCAGAELPPGGSCTVEVRFVPRLEEPAAAFLEIDSNAEAVARRLPLAGTGTAPRLTIEPPRLAFGEVGVGARSAARELVLRSAGSAPVTVEGVEIQGADAGAFSAVGCSGKLLEPGSACAVEVRFLPRRSGPHRAELRLHHGASAGGDRLPANGIGVVASLSLDRDRIDFGDVRTGREERRSLTLTNSGRSALKIARLRLTGDRESGFELAVDRCSGATLPPAASCTASVAFSAAAPGVRRIELVIDHSADAGPREVPMTATAF